MAAPPLLHRAALIILQTLREIASSAQAAAAAACLQAKQDAEARLQLSQQLELKANQIASLMAEGSASARSSLGRIP